MPSWPADGKLRLTFFTDMQVLTNFSTMFAGKFTPYASYEDGKLETFWQCDTCGERAEHGVQEGVVIERILSCPCRENHSYDLAIEKEMAMAAKALFNIK